MKVIKQLSLEGNHPALKWWDKLRATRLCNGTKDRGYYTDKYFKGHGARMHQWLTISEIIDIYELEFNQTPSANNDSDVIIEQQYKTCSLKCNAVQLESVGIPRSLLTMPTHNPIYYVKEFTTGYSQIKVERKAISSIIGKEYYVFYDIPTQWLTIN